MNDHPASDARRQLRARVEQLHLQNVIIALILRNAALPGLQTSASAMAASDFLETPSSDSITKENP
ncbi:MAG: hypothetical protein AW10_01500 [Candidatus Accumulibacter appositus]|uniref:Uncharacterized protein n=1 Tax=Candidatus Accumulibacter appositus TaxID=1454003 RepID=A0A011PV25_9PROT|nr:hypothetical protein [Accumulibacter sp.]EXI80887.1 MAG: hypothetical protein AW10_01500 [Candidatus Accumulibacter appositus]HRF03856.1 hypothetical protein [Accumulibacter sp.]